VERRNLLKRKYQNDLTTFEISQSLHLRILCQIAASLWPEKAKMNTTQKRSLENQMIM